MASFENQLTERFRRGDEAAFNELFDRMAKRVYRFALRMRGNPEDAEDVVSATFEELFRSRERFESRSSIETWIFRIALHVVHRQTRSAKKAIPLSDLLTDERAANGIESVELAHLVLQLPERLREVFLLVKVDGLTYWEASEITGQRMGTIQSQVYEARRWLQERLPAKRPAGTKEEHCYELP